MIEGVTLHQYFPDQPPDVIGNEEQDESGVEYRKRIVDPDDVIGSMADHFDEAVKERSLTVKQVAAKRKRGQGPSQTTSMFLLLARPGVPV